MHERCGSTVRVVVSIWPEQDIHARFVTGLSSSKILYSPIT